MNRAEVLKLLSPQGAEDRCIYELTGNLGQLFKNFNDPISSPFFTEKLRILDVDTQKHVVFDTISQSWVELTNELLDSIPKTYTFASRPESVRMELDYFLRGCGLIKHSFIWSVDNIPKASFAKLRSQSNLDFHGRYTATPWLPQIKKLGRMIHGWYIIDDDDWNKIYRKE